MTMIDSIETKCPVCNRDFEIYMIMSTNRMGSPDLDLRPPEMERSTMNTWTQECPHCGYVASDFNQTPQIDEEFLKSDSYQSCDNIDFKNNLSRIFYRQHLIETENLGKFNALLCCAWACDDADDRENAITIRNKAVEIVNNLDLDETSQIRKADVMRRAHRFEEVIEEYSDKKFSEELLNRIAEFQVEKSKDRNDECYTVEDVIKD